MLTKASKHTNICLDNWEKHLYLIMLSYNWITGFKKPHMDKFPRLALNFYLLHSLAQNDDRTKQLNFLSRFGIH